MSVDIPLMTRTKVSHNSVILAFEDNPASGVQAYGNGNMALALTGCKLGNICHLELIDPGLGCNTPNYALPVL